MNLGDVITFSVPEIFPSSVYGYEFFNFFFALPVITAIIIVIPLALIKIIKGA